MVEYHQVNSIPALLADTYMTLTQCHIKGGGKIRCCLAILDIWMLGHLYGKSCHLRSTRDTNSSPLITFQGRMDIDRIDRDEWVRIFAELREAAILWKLDWWWDEEVIYSCGTFPNVPLMGSRGCINYNPSVALRQLAFLQKVPSEEEIREIYFLHADLEMQPMRQVIREAWQKIVYRGKLELGIRVVNPAPEYITWFKNMTGGANPAYAPRDPMMGTNLQEINEHLRQRLEARERELQELTDTHAKSNEELGQLRAECETLQGQLTEKRPGKEIVNSSEYKRLKEENRRLKDTVRDQAVKLKNDKTRLMRMAKAKDALEEKLQESEPIAELQREIGRLTQLLEQKTSELARIGGDTTETIQNLANRLHQQTEALESWRSLCHDRTEDAKEWAERCKKMILLANESIPEFAWAFKRAENMLLPMGNPVEIIDFFNLCNQILEELNRLTRF